MALVNAYDTRTGKKLPNQVPEHWIDHPRIGRHLSRTPSATPKTKAASPATARTPAAGDEKE